MAIYPGALVRLIPKHNRSRMVAHNRVNLHVAVSEAASLGGYFSTAPVCSHFYVRKDGTVEQYIDTAYQSRADGAGNDATISIETQGGLRNAQGEPWTAAQVAALGALCAWAFRTHGIPARLATDSRPGESSRGLSWHRLGIDPWRVSGGMKYSSSRGKVCPGNAKIAQIPDVLAAATGSLVSASVTIPTANINLPGGVLPGDLTPKDGFDMAEVSEVVEALMERLVPTLTPIIKREALAAVVQAVDERQARDRRDMLEQAGKANNAVIAEIRATPERVWVYEVDGPVEGIARQARYLLRDARINANEAADNTRPAPVDAEVQ